MNEVALRRRLAYARYTHPLDQEADEGSLVVPQEERRRTHIRTR